MTISLRVTPCVAWAWASGAARASASAVMASFMVNLLVGWW